MFLHECDECSALEERVFTDSWTGVSFCLECLSRKITFITNSPYSEGDNLQELLDKEIYDNST